MNINLLNSPPHSHSLTCSGYDLASALKEIEGKGGHVESVDIVGVAKYRLNYFMCVSNHNIAVPGGPDHSGKPRIQPSTNCVVLAHERSIQERIDNLRLKAIESGRVRPMRVARVPHNSE